MNEFNPASFYHLLNAESISFCIQQIRNLSFIHFQNYTFLGRQNYYDSWFADWQILSRMKKLWLFIVVKYNIS